MFDDFSQNGIDRQARKRLGRSLMAASVVYVSSGAALVAATATARHVVEEELTQVEFAPPPEPEPPPPEPEPVKQEPQKSAQPKAKRKTIKPPDKVPLEKPKESDAPLAEAEDTGPVDGNLFGVEGGTGSGRVAPPPPPPPPPKPEPLVKPVVISESQPKYPKSALRKGIEGTVVVSIEVLENGRVANPKIVSGPRELHEAVLEAALTWRFKPAMRGGKPVRYRFSKRVTFRLEDA